MMVCKEDVEEEKPEEKVDETKRKDGKDKKFLYPHGITPPLKNVRKKRFRKTLKKKFVDVPEIEKEVRRLFKTDGEAVSVRYEVVNADEDNKDGKGVSGPNITNTNSQSMDIVEHDLFGDVVSSSDEDETRGGGRKSEESDNESRLSASSKYISQRDSFADVNASESTPYVTEFPKGMLNNQSQENSLSVPSYDIAAESTNAAAAVAALEEASAVSSHDEALLSKINDLQEEIRNLQERRRAQEDEIASIENYALKQRFQSLINSLIEQEAEKTRQRDEILSMLEQN
jgi:TATA-binding protein-associated factor Taf7